MNKNYDSYKDTVIYDIRNPESVSSDIITQEQFFRRIVRRNIGHFFIFQNGHYICIKRYGKTEQGKFLWAVLDSKQPFKIPITTETLYRRFRRSTMMDRYNFRIVAETNQKRYFRSMTIVAEYEGIFS